MFHTYESFVFTEFLNKRGFGPWEDAISGGEVTRRNRNGVEETVRMWRDEDGIFNIHIHTENVCQTLWAKHGTVAEVLSEAMTYLR